MGAGVGRIGQTPRQTSLQRKAKAGQAAAWRRTLTLRLIKCIARANISELRFPS